MPLSAQPVGNSPRCTIFFMVGGVTPKISAALVAFNGFSGIMCLFLSLIPLVLYLVITLSISETTNFVNMLSIANLLSLTILL